MSRKVIEDVADADAEVAAPQSVSSIRRSTLRNTAPRRGKVAARKASRPRKGNTIGGIHLRGDKRTDR